MKNWKLAAALFASVSLPSVASAADCEVTHWWTSGGEAAAVAEFAKAFNATGNNWVDGAIAGSATSPARSSFRGSWAATRCAPPS